MRPTPDDPTYDHASSPRDESAERYRFGPFALDVARRELRRGASIVEMPVRVFECLHHLLLHRARAVGRDELAFAVFHRHDVSDGQLAQLVLRTRRCVDDDGQAQKWIRTVPRFGFRWVGDIAYEPGKPAAVSSDTGGDSASVAPAPIGNAFPIADGGVVAALATGGRAPTVGVQTRGPISRHVSLVLLLTLVATIAGSAWLRGDNPERQPRRVAGSAATARPTALVLPARLQGGGDAAWIRLGLMDDLAEHLRRAGLSVPASEDTLALMEGTAAQPQRGELQTGDLQTRSGATWVVNSRVRRQGDDWHVLLAATTSGGQVHSASAVGRDVLVVARLACDRLLPMLGRVAPSDGASVLGLDERLQRARAAMLANQLDLARRILDEAPPSQIDQPHLRFRRAQVDYRSGALAESEGAMDDLLVDPQVRADPVFRARVLVYRGGARMRRNALAESLRDYDAAVAALRPGDDNAEHGAALNGRASVRAALGRHDEAILDFGAARLHLQRAGNPVGVARVDANLGALELERGHPAQGLGYLDGALAVFIRAGAINEQQVTRSALSATHLLMLDAGAALASADAAALLLPQTPDPTLRLASALDRANALIALGRLADARDLLRAPGVAASTTPPYEQRRAQTRVELAWQGGDVDQAVAIADAALANWPVMAGDAVRDRVRLRRAQAAEHVDTKAASDIGVVAGPTDTVPGWLVDAIALGEAPAATDAYRAALSLAESRGAPADIVLATTAYVPWLIRRGRIAQAGALVGRVSPWAERNVDVTRLQWLLARSQGDAGNATRLRARMVALAGERTTDGAGLPYGGW